MAKHNSRVIKTIIANDSLLESIARHSYSHELKFDKIVLWHDIKTDCVLRLHIWWPMNTVGHEEIDIHNHGRSFVSQLLVGEFHDQRWEIEPNGEIFFKYQYVIDNKTLESQMIDRGSASLRMKSDQLLRVGDRYDMDIEILHRTIPRSDRVTATIVIQSPVLSRHSDIYVKQKKNPQDSGRKVCMEKNALRYKLISVLDVLHGG